MQAQQLRAQHVDQRVPARVTVLEVPDLGELPQSACDLEGLHVRRGHVLLHAAVDRTPVAQAE